MPVCLKSVLLLNADEVVIFIKERGLAYGILGRFVIDSIFVVLFENWDMETKKFASKNVAFFLILWLYRIKVWDSEPLLIGLIFSCLRSFNWEACLVMVYMITRCLSKTLSFFPLVILYFYRFCKQLLATPDHTI